MRRIFYLSVALLLMLTACSSTNESTSGMDEKNKESISLEGDWTIPSLNDDDLQFYKERIIVHYSTFLAFLDAFENSADTYPVMYGGLITILANDYSEFYSHLDTLDNVESVMEEIYNGTSLTVEEEEEIVSEEEEKGLLSLLNEST